MYKLPYKLHHSNGKGSAITLVLLAVVILLVTGIGLLSIGLRSQILAVRTTSDIAARMAADAGLVEAIYKMNEKLQIKPWDESSLPSATNESLPNSELTYSYKVGQDLNGDYVIVSVGSSGQSTKQVECKLGIESPFDFAMFGSRYLSLKAGTTIDGYNFELPTEKLKIGVNSIEAGAIFARLGVLIDGDVFVGPGGDPNIVVDAQNEVVITGDYFVLAEARPLPAVPLPTHLDSLPSLGTITTSMTLSGNAKCDAISLTNNAVLTINGPVSLYVIGKTKIDTGAQIKIVDATINPDAYLNLYLGNEFTIQNGGMLNNNTKDTGKFKMYGLTNCTNFAFLTDSILYGAVYAPYANFSMLNKVEIYGALIVECLSQQVSSNFHYDAALQRGKVNDEFVEFVIERWRE